MSDAVGEVFSSQTEGNVAIAVFFKEKDGEDGYAAAYPDFFSVDVDAAVGGAFEFHGFMGV